MIKLQLINADIIDDTDTVTSRLFRKCFNCRYNPRMDYCLGTGVRASGEFAHANCTCQNCKIIGKVKTETTGM